MLLIVHHLVYFNIAYLLGLSKPLLKVPNNPLHSCIFYLQLLTIFLGPVQLPGTNTKAYELAADDRRLNIQVMNLHLQRDDYSGVSCRGMTGGGMSANAFLAAWLFCFHLVTVFLSAHFCLGVITTFCLS